MVSSSGGAILGGGSIVIDRTLYHNTITGYKHIPSGGSSGQYLKYSADGTAAWTTMTNSDVGLGNVNNTADSAKSVASATKLTTARAIKIGNTSKTFNGTANVSFSKSEIASDATTSANGWMGSSDKTSLAEGEALLELFTLGDGPVVDNVIKISDISTSTDLNSYIASKLNLTIDDTTTLEALEGITDIGGEFSTTSSKNALYNKTINDLDWLEYFPNLENLNLSGSSISGSVIISGLTKLKELYVAFTSITSVKLSALPSLTSLHSTFYKCSSLVTAEIHHLKNVYSSAYVFYYCTSLVSVNLIGMTNIINLVAAFYNCTALTSVNIKGLYNDIVVDEAFYNCTSLKYININHLTGIYSMRKTFLYCTSLISINLSGMTAVTDLYYAFAGCTNLTSANLNGMTGVTNLQYTFYGCTSLETVDLTNVPQKEGSTTFLNCPSSLVKIGR